jgi:hypothetical protein
MTLARHLLGIAGMKGQQIDLSRQQLLAKCGRRNEALEAASWKPSLQARFQ